MNAIGTLIRRHRIPKPDSEIGQHYTVAYFNVGKEVTFYAKTFKIVGCDKFTRVSSWHREGVIYVGVVLKLPISTTRTSSKPSTSPSPPTPSSPTTPTPPTGTS